MPGRSVCKHSRPGDGSELAVSLYAQGILYTSDIEPSQPRNTAADAARVARELSELHG